MAKIESIVRSNTVPTIESFDEWFELFGLRETDMTGWDRRSLVRLDRLGLLINYVIALRDLTAALKIAADNQVPF